MPGFVRTLRIIANISGLLLVGMGRAEAIDITGAGSTFAQPLYAAWGEIYQAKTGASLDYQAIGSGRGVQALIEQRVDFGATDAPLDQARLEREGLLQFPTAIGGVVPILNVPGVASGRLRLTGPLLADIFLGRVDRWDDGAIAALNPGVTLPDQPIVVVTRADSSGTTFVFTDYLSRVSPTFQAKVGSGTLVEWPVGDSGKGNEGVARDVKTIPGAIGYAEANYATKWNLAYGLVRNHDGRYPQPQPDAFAAAAAGATWSPITGAFPSLADQPGADSWPITSATYVLMHKAQHQAERGRRVLAFFDWNLANGEDAARQLGYLPLPAVIAQQLHKTWTSTIGGDGQPVRPE